MTVFLNNFFKNGFLILLKEMCNISVVEELLRRDLTLS